MNNIDLNKLEEISRLRLSSKEKEELISELHTLISNIEKIRRLDILDIEPVFNVRESLKYKNLRNDECISDNREYIKEIEIAKII